MLPLIIQFQAMGKARESLVCSILRKGVLDIPLLFPDGHPVPPLRLHVVRPWWDGISWWPPPPFTAACGGGRGLISFPKRRNSGGPVGAAVLFVLLLSPARQSQSCG